LNTNVWCVIAWLEPYSEFPTNAFTEHPNMPIEIRLLLLHRHIALGHKYQLYYGRSEPQGLWAKIGLNNLLVCVISNNSSFHAYNKNILLAWIPAELFSPRSLFIVVRNIYPQHNCILVTWVPYLFVPRMTSSNIDKYYRD
jgi:hypothetical protein